MWDRGINEKRNLHEVESWSCGRIKPLGTQRTKRKLRRKEREKRKESVKLVDTCDQKVRCREPKKESEK